MPWKGNAINGWLLCITKKKTNTNANKQKSQRVCGNVRGEQRRELLLVFEDFFLS